MPMRDYQPKRNNPYLLPPNLYSEVKYMIKDFERLNKEYKEITDVFSEDRNWAKICTVASKISAIKTAMLQIPPEYRSGLFKNIMNERTKDGYYPCNADYRTYQSYKQKLIYSVARNMNYV